MGISVRGTYFRYVTDYRTFVSIACSTLIRRRYKKKKRKKDSVHEVKNEQD